VMVFGFFSAPLVIPLMTKRFWHNKMPRETKGINATHATVNLHCRATTHMLSQSVYA
jgi:hypothetical protein